MASRRAFLCAVTAVGLAGCGGRLNETEFGDTDRGADGEADQQTVERDGVVNVREFGASGDGETDDSEAIRDALDAATDGETVYFPEPEAAYVLAQSGEEPVIEISGERHADGLTLVGDGQGSVIRVADGTSRSYNLFRVVSPEDFSLTFRNLVLDGNRGGVGEFSGPGECLTFRDNAATGSGDMVVENVEVRDALTVGINIQYGGVTCRHTTIRDCGTHGIGVATGWSGVHDPSPRLEHCYVADNSQGPYGTGIDFSNGKGIAEDVVIEGTQGNAGTKVSVGAIDVEYRRVRIRNNRGVVFQNTGEHDGASVTFEDVIGEDNDGPFRLSDTAEYTVPEGSRLVMRDNAVDDRGQIFLTDDAVLEAEGEVCSNRTGGFPGLHSNTDATGSYIRNYAHSATGGRAIRAAENLTIFNEDERMVADIRGVPLPGDVGAWRLPGLLEESPGAAESD